MDNKSDSPPNDAHAEHGAVSRAVKARLNPMLRRLNFDKEDSAGA